VRKKKKCFSYYSTDGVCQTPMADSRVVVGSSFFLVLSVNFGIVGQQIISWQADRSHCTLLFSWSRIWL